MTSNTCPICETPTAAAWCCGLDLGAARPWRMTPARIRAVHVLALATKGLDEDTYRLRLGAAGVSTCTRFTRTQYTLFMRELGKLPDAAPPRKLA